ncbi:MAG: hypothetical protein ABI345_10665 [Jatrophihabitans sp.]
MTQPPPELPGYRFERLLGPGGYSDGVASLVERWLTTPAAGDGCAPR